MKYYNKKTTIDGIVFDSAKEAKRYNELKMLERAHIIDNLQMQKVFELQPKYINCIGQHIRAITYIADFYYYDNEFKKWVVEDTKGFRTEVYKIKKKLFEYKYNMIIKEI